MNNQTQEQAVDRAFEWMRSGTPARVREGSALLFRTMATPLTRYFTRHRVHSNVVEELMQTVMVKVLEHVPAGRVNPDSPPLRWLWTVAFSVMVSHFRREGVVVTMSDDDWDSYVARLPSAPGVPAWLRLHVERGLVRFEIENPAKAELLRRVVEGVSIPELAAEFGASEAAVRDRLYRARQRLAEYVDGWAQELA